MRVLLVSSNSGGTGGGERYLTYLSAGLKQLGHEVSALVGQYSYMDGTARGLTDAGAEVRREAVAALRERRLRFVSSVADLPQQKRLKILYEDMRPDVVHVNQQYDEDGLDFLMAGLRSRIATAGTIHLPMCRTKRQRPFGAVRTVAMRQWYRRFNYPKVFVSEDARQEFVELYGDERSCFAVPNGVPVNGASGNSPAALPAGWSAEDPVIAFFGRLEEQKDPLLLLEAWLKLRKEMPRCRLLLAGDGALRGKLEAAAREAGAADDLFITGWLSDPHAYWTHIRVFALSSRYEGMSLSLLEALCRGKKAVATRCSGVAEAARKAPWLEVVESRSAGVFAQALLRAMKKEPPTEAETEKARQYFSVRRMAEQTVEVYRTAQRGGQEEANPLG